MIDPMQYLSQRHSSFILACSLAASLSHASTMQHDHAHDMADMAPAAQAPGVGSAGLAGVAGVAGEAGKVSRTIDIVMSDTMRFAPDKLTVKAGETIRFVVRNAGQIKHEFNIGTPASLKEHAQVMLKHSNMQHTEANVASLLPGKTGEVIWQFTRPGTVTFACLQPGHMSAGMKGSIQVSAAK